MPPTPITRAGNNRPSPVVSSRTGGSTRARFSAMTTGSFGGGFGVLRSSTSVLALFSGVAGACMAGRGGALGSGRLGGLVTGVGGVAGERPVAVGERLGGVGVGGKSICGLLIGEAALASFRTTAPALARRSPCTISVHEGKRSSGFFDSD